MDPLEYWRLKVYQLLHDPPGKAFHLRGRGRGSRSKDSPTRVLTHAELARELFEVCTGSDAPKEMTRADRAATGADRAVTAPRRRMLAVTYQVREDSMALHPLAPRAKLMLDRPEEGAIVTPEEVRDDDELQRDVMGFLGKIVLPGWDNSEQARLAALAVWRRTREEIVLRSSGTAAHDHPEALWMNVPADTRMPDHSIWDHTRMASALAFLNTPMKQGHVVPEANEPWLLQVSLTPIGEFIRQSRKAQDLWVSSFLLADLAWHAMLPIVEHYGPENIVYPDLRGNPLVDHWLRRRGEKDVLPESVSDPSTFAALVPNAFTAIVPKGGAGHLIPVKEIARRCSEGVAKRWSELASMVLQWFIRKAELSDDEETKLRSVWEQQHRSVIQVRWTALPWRLPESNGSERADRLKGWVPPKVWERYEQARDVFAAVDKGFTVGERGFDYALTHHQLRVRHGMRKQTATSPSMLEQPGEKCTICKARAALGDLGRAPHAKHAAIESRRQHVRLFWTREWLDPEKTGAERLCAVCAFKRFLVQADGEKDTALFNTTWAGDTDRPETLRRDGGGIVRVPFPSTSAIAAQRFLAAVVKDRELRSLVAAVDEAQKATGFKETQFPRSLPTLAAAYAALEETDEAARRFLRLEPQETVFPRSLDVWLTRKKEKKDQIQRLQQKSQELLTKAREVWARKKKTDPRIHPREREPGTRFAVIRMDGDSMGKLLLGDAKRIAATWRDILHPKHLAQMEKNATILDAGWAALLDRPRLMGPALHAFISRALACFTHTVVPWVVEQEYAGRLIYAGGDDILALAPAEDAVKVAARLREIFSFAWVVDTRPDGDPWSWRRPGAVIEIDHEKARDRFRQLGEDGVPPTPNARVFPMLGGNASLSAGIAIGHFKTPLRGMLSHAQHLLDEVAKGEQDKSALAVSYYTRSGPKYELAMKWQVAGDSLDAPMRADVLLDTVTRAFEDGTLPSRLPYKLREAAESVHGAIDALKELGRLDELPELMTGIFRREMDRKRLDAEDEVKVKAALALWHEGLKKSRKKRRDPLDRLDRPKDAGEPMVDGLLLARALASGDAEDEE